MKTQLIVWEKILVNHVSDKELITRYIMNTYNLI